MSDAGCDPLVMNRVIDRLRCIGYCTPVQGATWESDFLPVHLPTVPLDRKLKLECTTSILASFEKIKFKTDP